MKEKLRNSSKKPKRLHGFRAKPWSHRPAKSKRKPGGMGNRRSRVRR